MFIARLILPFLLFLIIFIILAVREGKNNHMDNKHNAKYAFYYLLSLAALIFMAVSFGMIIFSIIDKTIPDVINGYTGGVDSQLKFAISALFIAAPIFYFISRLIHRGLHKGELEKESGIRRWLTYFIILVSALIILGVFVGVINNFLSGELTGRFIFKALTMLLIAGVSFSFYFYDIKRENPDRPDKVVRIFCFASLALVLAAFTAAWFFVESPSVARARRLDQALIQNFYSLENAANSYYDRYKKLPADLAELKTDKNIYLAELALIDPETKTPISYNKVSDKEFEFCATFRTDSIAENAKQGNSYIGLESGSKEHRAGYQCLRGNLYSLSAEAAKAAAISE